MYLEPQAAAEAVRRFYEALLPGGYLVLSPVDGGLVGELELESEDAGVYRKAGGEKSSLHFLSHGVKENEAKEQRASESQAALDRAKRLLQGGFWEPAELLLKPLTEAEPADESLGLLFSYSLMRQEKYETALEVMLAQIDRGHSASQLYRLLAACYYQQGDNKKAEEQLRKALYLTPDDGAAHQLQGLVLYDEKPERAKKHFAKAAALSTRSLVGLNALELSEVPL